MQVIFCYMRKLLTILVALYAIISASAQPKLAVNIIVGGMSASDIDRYAENLSNDGFLRLKFGGTTFTECYTEFIPTSPEVAIATVATGSLPSMHGISSNRWFDRTSGNTPVSLCLNFKGRYTTEHFTIPTLAQTLQSSDSGAVIATIAHNYSSAMTLAGKGGECYWIDTLGNWTTAQSYLQQLPEWVVKLNENGINRTHVTGNWFGKLAKSKYLNKDATDIKIYDIYGKALSLFSKKPSAEWVAELKSTPAGNKALFDFAKKTLEQMMADKKNNSCRMLNICLDVPRAVAEKYGPNSTEYEDMLYYLDADLAEFLQYIDTLYPNGKNYLITLTSDSGMGNKYIEDNPNLDLFNPRQTAAILNAFLSAQYGQGSWVLECSNGAIYLNRDLIYAKRLSVAQIQNEAATFALQFRGVANAATATTLQGGAMSSNTSRLMQNSFHPRRSGDILYCLQPDFYELDEGKVAKSGSPYNYNRHIPLIFYGNGIATNEIDRTISSTAIAVTTAYLLGISRPDCADGELIYELKKR